VLAQSGSGSDLSELAPYKTHPLAPILETPLPALDSEVRLQASGFKVTSGIWSEMMMFGVRNLLKI
jgi:hypothetical protein